MRQTQVERPDRVSWVPFLFWWGLGLYDYNNGLSKGKINIVFSCLSTVDDKESSLQSINQSISFINSYCSQETELHERSANTIIIGIYK